MNKLRLFCCCQSLINDALLMDLEEKMHSNERKISDDNDDSFNTKTQGEYPARKETVVSVGSKVEDPQSSL